MNAHCNFWQLPRKRWKREKNTEITTTSVHAISKNRLVTILLKTISMVFFFWFVLFFHFLQLISQSLLYAVKEYKELLDNFFTLCQLHLQNFKRISPFHFLVCSFKAACDAGGTVSPFLTPLIPGWGSHPSHTAFAVSLQLPSPACPPSLPRPALLCKT